MMRLLKRFFDWLWDWYRPMPISTNELMKKVLKID
jgi:hypothetical protein